MKHLIDDSHVPWQDLGQGIKRKIMAHDPQMMIVKVAFEKGAVGALHSHPHTQSSYVASGSFEINIDGISQLLKKGDVYFVPSGLVHGAVCVEAGELIDVFSPAREDFIETRNSQKDFDSES